MANVELKESLVVTQPATPAALGYGTEYGATDRVQLWDYWQAVRKHIWLVTGLTLLFTTLVTLYLFRKPNIYEAEALVQVDLEELNPALGAASKNNPVVVNSAVNDPAYFNTQLRILNSAALLRRVVKTLDLENNKDFLRPLVSVRNTKWYQTLSRWVGAENKRPQREGEDLAPLPAVATTTSSAAASAPPVMPDLEEARRLAPYVKQLQEDLKIEPVVERRLGYARDNTRLIEIGFAHRDPQLAAKAVNSIADAFVLLNLERKAETNVSTGDFLQKRVAELQAQIRGSEERLINYARNHQILSLNPEQNTVVERLVGLNKQLLEAENKRKLAEATYQAAREPGAATALAEEHAARQVIDMESRLAEARQRYAQLLVENTEEWPEVKEVKQQITALEEEVKKTRNRSTAMTLRNFETQYRQALATEQALRKSFDQQRAETLTQNEAAINYRIIQQEIETNKNLLDGLLQRYKENDVVLAGIRNNIHVIDYAVPSDRPIGPRRGQGIVLALLFSLVFSMGLAIFLEYLNNTVTTADEIERLLHLPVLVTIPAIGGMRLGNAHPELLFEAENSSALAEAYRQLRTSVLLSTPGHAPRTLLVTSSLPSEGKTTTAVNLAICLAQTGSPVLLIDADMRRPRLRTLFHTDNRTGLSTYLSSQMTETALRSAIEQHSETKLNLLGAGPVPPNPAELLSSERMRKLLAALEPHFTYIVIDSPPAASFTDAVVLSSLVDGVLIVSHSGKTPRDAIRRTRQLLTGAGAKIFGVVLNQVEVRQHSYYYQSYYEYAVERPDDLEEGARGVHVTSPPTPLALPAAPAEEMQEMQELEAEQKRADLAAAAARKESEDAFRQICAAFNDPLPSIRDAAARALCDFSTDHTDSFARAFREATPEGRRRIGAAIASSGLAREAINHLNGSYNGSSFDALSLLLTMMKAGEIDPLLRAIEDHPDLEARIAVIRLLSLSHQAEIVPAMRRLALNDSLPLEVHSALLAAIYPVANR
jgi:polysaccharide biosynthesis transport protein